MWPSLITSSTPYVQENATASPHKEVGLCVRVRACKCDCIMSPPHNPSAVLQEMQQMDDILTEPQFLIQEKNVSKTNLHEITQ